MTVNDHCVSALALAEPPAPDTHLRRIDHDAVQRAAQDLLRALCADASEPADHTGRQLASGRARSKGVGVVLQAEHLCMSLRGAQKLGAKTMTSALRGLVRDDARTPPGVPAP